MCTLQLKKMIIICFSNNEISSSTRPKENLKAKPANNFFVKPKDSKVTIVNVFEAQYKEP